MNAKIFYQIRSEENNIFELLIDSQGSYSRGGLIPIKNRSCLVIQTMLLYDTAHLEFLGTLKMS